MTFPRWRSVDVLRPDKSSRVPGLGVQVEDLTTEERTEGQYTAQEKPRRFTCRITEAARSVRPHDLIQYQGENHKVAEILENARLGRIVITAVAARR